MQETRIHIHVGLRKAGSTYLQTGLEAQAGPRMARFLARHALRPS